MGFTLYISGYLLLFLGSTMFIPACLDYYNHSIASAESFVFSAFWTLFWGGLFVLTFKKEYKKITIPQMYLATTVCWIIVTAYSAVPFVFSPMPVSYTSAFFEAISGLSTMGASVYPNIEAYPEGIVLWRSLLQWFGGLGIIAFAMLLLPFLRIGGMQLFLMENSDKSNKQKPKAIQVVQIISIVYVGITLACILCLWATELTLFESINYSFTTISTGGFAPRNTSAIGLSGWAQCILIFFMFISGLPLFSFYFLYKMDFKTVFKDLQIKSYSGACLVVSIILTLWIVLTVVNQDTLTVFRTTLFNVVSVISSTGLNASDLELGGMFAMVLFIFLTPVGACTGSTSGGIKIFRFNILLISMMQSFRQRLMPHVVSTPKFNNRPITLDVMLSVFIFMVMFGITTIFSVLVIVMSGVDLLTALSAVFSALGNTGIGVGPIVGTTGAGYGSLPDLAKWVLSLDMLLGRLEYMGVFLLIMPMMWRNNNSRRIKSQPII